MATQVQELAEKNVSASEENENNLAEQKDYEVAYDSFDPGDRPGQLICWKIFIYIFVKWWLVSLINQ